MGWKIKKPKLSGAAIGAGIGGGALGALSGGALAPVGAAAGGAIGGLASDKVGGLFNKVMGETEMKSASTLDPIQRALLAVGASSLADKLPSAIDVMSKGMTSMDNAYDAAGSAGVLAAMKANNLAAANRTKALNAAKFQRTGLGRSAANTLTDESLGRLNAEADKWDVTNKQGALENAYTRQQQWTQLLNSLYGASLGNTMENAAIKNPGLPEVAATFANLAGGAKAAGLV